MRITFPSDESTPTIACSIWEFAQEPFKVKMCFFTDGFVLLRHSLWTTQNNLGLLEEGAALASATNENNKKWNNVLVFEGCDFPNLIGMDRWAGKHLTVVPHLLIYISATILGEWLTPKMPPKSWACKIDQIYDVGHWVNENNEIVPKHKKHVHKLGGTA